MQLEKVVREKLAGAIAEGKHAEVIRFAKLVKPLRMQASGPLHHTQSRVLQKNIVCTDKLTTRDDDTLARRRAEMSMRLTDRNRSIPDRMPRVQHL